MAKEDNVIRAESWTPRPRVQNPQGEATMPSSDVRSEDAVSEAPASAAVDFGVTQVVDGNWGVHAILSKRLFSDAP